MKLIPIEEVNGKELFAGEQLDHLLQEIEQVATDFNPDLTTAKGRREIASRAHKVARSKVVIDTAGKELVAEAKAGIREVDERRKVARDFLSDLKIRIRAPLDDWEAERARIKAAEELEAEVETAHAEALEYDVFWTDKRRAEEEAARLRAEAEEATRAARQEAREQALAEAAEKEKERAVERARQEERREAQYRADEKAEEIQREERMKEQARQKREAQAADRDHRAKVNREVLAFLKNYIASEPNCKALMLKIVKGEAPHMSINY